MIGIVVAAHAELAGALEQAASAVLGDLDNFVSIAVDPRDGAGEIQQKFQAAIDKVRLPPGVLILTDMFGGTPANIGLTLHEPQKVELLTGVNLPMVIKAAQLAGADLSLTEVAETVKQVGIRSITIASDLMPGGQTTERRAGNG